MSKSAVLTRSMMGRVSLDFGDFSFRPRALPEMTRITAIPRLAALATPYVERREHLGHW